jgi:CRISPR-associated protein Cas2
MTVLILERVPPGLRGDLSRWMIEVSTGVFVGDVSGLVREQLWEQCTGGALEGGSAQLIHPAATPQGFDVRTLNPRGRYAERVDGVWLVRVP